MPLSDSMSSGDAFQALDRRQNTRHSSSSLSYVHLDESNGGILINLSEGGLAVHAAMSVMEDELPRVRLQVPRSAKWLETTARVVWSSDSRRMVGIRFLDLQPDTRKQIREWLAQEAGENAAVFDESGVLERELRVANVEEIPLKPLRQPQQTPVQAAHAPEFDVAELFAVARSMKIPAETAQPVMPGPVTKEAPAAIRKAPGKKLHGRLDIYAPILVVLALLSLVSGWRVGKGNIFPTLRALFLPSSAATPEATAGTATGPPRVFATNFEVVDQNNQAWLVPFAGPTSAPSGPALPALPPKAAASLNQPLPRNSNSFQLWTLAAPQSQHSKPAQTAAAAPVLPTPQSGAPLPSSLAEAGPNFSLAPPSEQAQPAQVHSSLVEPKLLHSIQPTYPTSALNQHIEGNVTLRAHISENGTITNVTAADGPALLIPAAVSAVRQWKYRPEMLDGQAVASDIVVTVEFSLPR